MKYTTLQIQRALRFHNFYDDDVDGIRGPKTDAAIVAFKKSIGYRARPYMGPLTLAALFKGRRETLELTEDKAGFKTGSEALNSRLNAPVWLRVASSYIGAGEWQGSEHNPVIVTMFERIFNPWFTDDETPWCAAFVGSVLEECGIASTRSARARSYDNYGVDLVEPCFGSIGVLTRGNPGNGKGHVIFVTGRDEFGNIVGIGGNQSNKVSEASFNIERFVGFRYPKSAILPDDIGFDNLPIIRSRPKLSNNEA